ncbi:MAG: hypothetical protein WBB28_18095 [Crinalium sp.]
MKRAKNIDALVMFTESEGYAYRISVKKSSQNQPPRFDKFMNYRYKILALTSILALGGLLMSPPASAHQWVRVATDNYDHVYRLDKQVGGRGRFRRYWMSVVLSQQDPSYDTKWKKVLSSIDCKLMQRRIRTIVWYDINNKIIETENYGGDGNLETIPRHSIEGRIANTVCSLK